jgi:hypothetical protein
MDCIRFIMMKLVEKGFEVHLAIPNNIFISWKKESNPDYSRQMYLTEAPAIMNSFKSSSKSNNLALMPPGSSYPLTDQDFKKSLGLGYADSGENLPVSTCTASLTPRCYNTYSRLRDNKKYTSGSSGSNNINADSNYKLFSSRPTVKKEKNYRPIEDYRQTNIDSSNGGFASSLDDINLFHSKLDELLA